MLSPSISRESLLAGLQSEEKKQGRQFRDATRTLFAADAVLRTWLGKSWLKKRLPTHEFFNPRPLGLETDHFMQLAAIVDLAEFLLNMQHVEGVEHLVARIVKGQRIADDVAELAGASLLHRAGICFKFVKPTGKKGADYDVEAILGGERVCFEMKGKVADPSVRTVVQTLRDAADQVPRDTPNVVVIQPPNGWMIAEDGVDALRDGVAEFFRKGDRVAQVIVHADDWRTLRQEGVAEIGGVVARRCLGYAHPNPAVQLPTAAANTTWLDETGRHWLGLENAVALPDRLRHIEQVSTSYVTQVRRERNNSASG